MPGPGTYDSHFLRDKNGTEYSIPKAIKLRYKVENTPAPTAYNLVSTNVFKKKIDTGIKFGKEEREIDYDQSNL